MPDGDACSAAHARRAHELCAPRVFDSRPVAILEGLLLAPGTVFFALSETEQ